MTVAQPYPIYLPQSIKIYPIHQLMSTVEPPLKDEWNPRMNKNILNYVYQFGSQTKIGRQLYIHVPFCPAFCHFCALYKTMKPNEQGADFIERFVQALLTEITYYGQIPAAQLRRITSIYFGGGTPTMLIPQQVERILEAIRKYLPLVEEPEITFEGMAHHLKNKEYLASLCANGVNRISYGVQTFDRALRKQLGRLDTVEDVFSAADAILSRSEIRALNFELLLGLPEQTLEILLQDLKHTVMIRPHSLDILFYNAVPGTKYYDFIRQGKRKPQSAGQDLLRLRRESIQFLKENGYFHTTGEIFSREEKLLDNFNETHYGGTTGIDEMLSLGPSSYGFLEGTAYQNVASVSDYIELLQADRLPIRTYQAINLRQAKRRALLFGLQLGYISERAINSFQDRLNIKSWKERHLIQKANGGWQLTEQGKIWYNMMQLEAIPLTEAGGGIDLVFDIKEQRRLLFNPHEKQGNIALARQIEQLIEGDQIWLRPLRRVAFKMLRNWKDARTQMTFVGPKQIDS